MSAWATPPWAGSSEDVDIAGEFHEAAMKFTTPANVKPMRVVVDGGNGMGGPDGGPLFDSSRRSTL